MLIIFCGNGFLIDSAEIGLLRPTAGFGVSGHTADRIFPQAFGKRLIQPIDGANNVF